MSIVSVTEEEILCMSDEDQRREAFAYYGLASYHVQCVERQMAILLAITEFPDIVPRLGREFEQYLDSSFERTFGQLLTRMRKMGMPADILDMLGNALEKRNWLTHHYFWDRATHLLTSHGRCKVILELVDVVNMFNELDEKLSGICAEWYEKHGLTEEVLQTFLELSVAEEDRD